MTSNISNIPTESSGRSTRADGRRLSQGTLTMSPISDTATGAVGAVDADGDSALASQSQNDADAWDEEGDKKRYFDLVQLAQQASTGPGSGEEDEGKDLGRYHVMNVVWFTAVDRSNPTFRRSCVFTAFPKGVEASQATGEHESQDTQYECGRSLLEEFEKAPHEGTTLNYLNTLEDQPMVSLEDCGMAHLRHGDVMTG